MKDGDTKRKKERQTFQRWIEMWRQKVYQPIQAFLISGLGG